MAEELGPSQERPFAQQAREVAEGIKGSEAVLEEDRAQLSRDMLEVKKGLMEANRHLPGMIIYTTMSSAYSDFGNFAAQQREYRNDHEVVVLSEPVRGEGGQITYVVVTPAGFKGLTFSDVIDEKLVALEEVLQGGGPVVSDEINGYYELPSMDPISGKTEGKLIPQLFLGGITGSGRWRGKDAVVFKGDELIDVPEETVMEAYARSQEAAAGKLKKVGDVDEQRQAIQGQRAIGQRLLESMRQQPPPPAAGQS